jgi:hypothetical protein
MVVNDTTAKMSFEVEIDLTGKFCAGYPESGPTYSSGGEPGEADGIEDMEITGVGYLSLDRSKKIGDVTRYVTTSITQGVDMRNPEVQKLLASLLEIVHDDAELALLDEARGA